MKTARTRTAQGLQTPMLDPDETLTIDNEESTNSGVNETILSPEHAEARRLIDTLRQGGRTPTGRQISALLRKAFPEPYQRTHKHWQTKINNAKTQGYHVADDFKIFWAFIYHVGFKPPTGSYQIHRKNNDEGYSLMNCTWLDQTSNLEKRGISDEIRRYMKKHGVSRATAYRHLKAQNPLPDYEGEARRTRAEKFYTEWYRLLMLHYPKTVSGIPHPQRGKMKIIEAFDQENGHLLAGGHLEYIVKNWGGIQSKVKSSFGKFHDIGMYPLLETLIKQFGRVHMVAHSMIHDEHVKTGTHPCEP